MHSCSFSLFLSLSLLLSPFFLLPLDPALFFYPFSFSIFLSLSLSLSLPSSKRICISRGSCINPHKHTP